MMIAYLLFIVEYLDLNVKFFAVFSFVFSNYFQPKTKYVIREKIQKKT